MLTRQEKNLGFSLIELVIVIVIMGLITAVTLPNFSKIQNKAKEASEKNIAHGIQLAIESYFLNHGTYPAGSQTPVSTLITTLQQSGEYTQSPSNPFTGQSFQSGDTLGKMVYTADNAQGTYTLTIYGSDSNTSILVLQNM